MQEEAPSASPLTDRAPQDHMWNEDHKAVDYDLEKEESVIVQSYSKSQAIEPSVDNVQQSELQD
jgi:hypothetical protein